MFLTQTRDSDGTNINFPIYKLLFVSLLPFNISFYIYLFKSLDVIPDNHFLFVS